MTAGAVGDRSVGSAKRSRGHAAETSCLIGGLVLTVIVAFSPVLGNDFVNWDDDLNLTNNSAYRGFSAAHLRWMLTTTHGGHYQPLTWLSFALDHALWGMDPRGYHLTNLLLHAANAVLVWMVLRALLAPLISVPRSVLARVAALGALCFAIHPLRVESVAWATERRDVLSGGCWLLALLAYLRAVAAPPAGRGRWLLAALGALVLSLLAKAWGVTFPLVLLLLDAYPLRRLHRDPGRVLREKLPFAIAAGGAAALALVAAARQPDMRSLTDHGPLARLAQAAYGLCFYVVETLAPVHLHPAYLLEPDLDPTRPRYLAAMAAVVAVTTIAVALRRRRPWLLAVWAGYVVIVLPVLGLAQTGPQLVADRYVYLAGLPWMVLLTAALARAWTTTARSRRQRALAGASIALLLLLAVLTYRQSGVWRDSRTLWDHTLAIDPDNWIAYTNRGWIQGDPAAAIADYTAAIRANPRYYLAYFNRGNARHERGDFAGALADHSAAIALLPDDPKAYNNRGWARQALGDWAGAAADYERALALADPTWPERGLVTGNLAAARARITVNDR